MRQGWVAIAAVAWLLAGGSGMARERNDGGLFVALSHSARHHHHARVRGPHIIVLQRGFPRPEPLGWFDCCT